MVKTAPDVKGEMAVGEWYKGYYSRGGSARNNIRQNPGVLFQILAAEAAFSAAIRNVGHDPAGSKVLDIGCGSGGDMFQLFRSGYLPENVYGIDIQSERLEAGRKLYPAVKFLQEDASKMQFGPEYFDLIFESTMFATLPNEDLCVKIAEEMLRVLANDGYILLVDWRTPKPGDPNYSALTKQRLKKLFHLGERTELVGVYPGALVTFPPKTGPVESC